MTPSGTPDGRCAGRSAPGSALRILAACLCMLIATGCRAVSAGTIPVHDGYTVSQRFESNRESFPELRWPVLTVRDGQRIEFDRRYKAIGARELHLDLFLPPRGKSNRRAIVLVHGGGWQSGNKSNFYPMANLLAQRGYTAILPEFRLSPEARYPAGLIDVRDAIDWVAAHAADYGIEPDRIAIGGESSGGHMAALLAYTGGTRLFTSDGGQARRIDALIDIDGVLDLTSPMALSFENRAGSESPMARWLGGSREQKADLWKQANPVAHLGQRPPPTLVISGGHDRFTVGRDRVGALLSSRGVPFRHVHFERLPHTFWLFEPYLEQVVEAIDHFLRTSA